jgi:FkbM family methyltransferase
MGLGVKRAVVGLLDRQGFRGLLAWGVNVLISLRGTRNLKVFHDNGLWFHTAGGVTFPGSPQFDQDPARIDELLGMEPRFLADAEDYWFHFITPTEGAFVLDVGAGQGEDVLALARAVGARGRVLAVEAYPSTFKALAEFSSRNALTNVVPIHVALGMDERQISFQESVNWVENAIIDATAGATSVRCTTITSICGEYGITGIDYIKMNIEGAEREALKGMTEIIGKVAAICVSCHDFRADRGDGEQFRSKGFVIGFLEDNGFDLFCRDDPRPYVRDQVFGVNRSAQLGRAPRFRWNSAH